MLYRYYLTQRGISIGTQPNGFVSKLDTEGGELTNGRRCYGYVEYDRELTEQEIKMYELTPHSKTVRLRENKPFSGWDDFAEKTGKTSYDDYCKPGDIVDEETYNYFLNILPPLTMRRGYFQVGEPYSTRIDEKTGKYRETWPTFKYDGERYYYLGNCFAGEEVEHGREIPIVG